MTRHGLTGLALLGILLAVVLGAGSGGAANPEPPLVDVMSLQTPGQAVASHQIAVRFGANAPAAIQALNATHGAQVLKNHPRSGLQLLQLPASANAAQVIDAYRRSPIVLEAGPSHTVFALDGPNDSHYSRQWHMHDTSAGVRVEPAWSLAPGAGAGVTVAVIDTGVAYEEFTRPAGGGLPSMSFRPAPDLAGITFVAPWNYIHGDAHANDDHGHGTHVSGTIGQTTNNAYGQVGVAFNASIMPIKILDYSGQGNGVDLADSIIYAVDNGADVISMSLGFPNTGLEDANGDVCTEIVGLRAALDYAYDNGVVVVAAAGNDGNDTVICPAAYPSVIAVGASTLAAQVAFYSNRGAALDVVAPGGDPNADLNGDGFSDGVLQEMYCDPGSWIILIAMLFNRTAQFHSFCSVFLSGTSMATPHVSGIAALLLGQDPSLSPDEVRAAIEERARDGGSEGWDPAFGWGIVDAAAAVQAIDGSSATPTPTPTSTPTPTPTPTETPTPTSTSTPTNTPTPVSTDTVVIARAQYHSGRAELTVDARSDAAPDAVLSVYDITAPGEPLWLGDLQYVRQDRYQATLAVSPKPSQILVESSAGGSATSPVR